MTKRVIKFSDESRDAMKAGIDLVADAVKVTLGPKGRNAMLDIDQFRPPLVTNDGVTVAREILPDDPLARAGAKFAKEVANKTNDIAGDGTTTATILLQAIITEGMKRLSVGVDVTALRRGIENGATAIIQGVMDQKTETNDIDSLTHIAKISSGDDRIGEIVGEVVEKVGASGVVTIEDSEEADTSYHITEGLELRGGFQVPIFVTNPARQVAEFKDVPVLVTDHDVTNGLEVVKIMETCAAAGKKAAVLIANNITGEALTTCVLNRAQGKFSLLPIRVQAWGDSGIELLRDVAKVTDAVFMSKEEGHSLPNQPTDNIPYDNFGVADKIIATKERTTVVADAGDRKARIKELQAQLPNIKAAFKREQVEERIAKLKSGVGVIRVAGANEQVRDELKLRVEDSVNSTKAALASGVVPGGGSALYRAAANVEDLPDGSADVYIGYSTVVEAAKYPLQQLLKNSGVPFDNSEIKKLCDNDKLTYDFVTGEIVDAKKQGILDPAKVVVSALQNAAASAALFLTTEVAVVNNDEDLK